MEKHLPPERVGSYIVVAYIGNLPSREVLEAVNQICMAGDKLEGRWLRNYNEREVIYMFPPHSFTVSVGPFITTAIHYGAEYVTVRRK